MNSLAKRYGVSLFNVLPILLLSGRSAISYTPDPRWGQAVVLLNDTLFVYGGKTDLFNSYSYTSAPTTNELLYLPLSQPFDTASAPWGLMNSPNTSQIPDVSWHTLSAFNYSGMLLFGGQPGTSSPIVTFDGADSASFLDLSNSQPAWYSDLSWVGEPVRRIFHTSVTCPTTGRIYIVGGLAADGSQRAFSDHYMFDPHTLAFSIIPPNNIPPAIYGHASVIFTDGRMFVFGGVSEDTLNPLSDVWTLDTNNINAVWDKMQVDSSSLPLPRRAFAAVAIGQGKILIQGGSDAILQNNMNDGWILDTTKDPAVWTEVAELTQLGARRDHYAILSNNLVIFGFGYLNSGPAPAAIQIFDITLKTYPPSYLPPPPSTPVTQTIPGSAPTVSGTGTGTPLTGPTITSTSSGSTPPGPAPTAEPGGHVNDKKNSVVATAVGITLGIIGAAALVLTLVVYARRRQRGNQASFTTIEDDNDGDSRNLHGDPLMPIATRYNEKGVPGTGRWGHNLLGTAFSIAGTIGGKSRNTRHTYRRDMLADEDSREFGEWYNARHREGTGGSSWSLKSVFGARFRSRDPSIFGSGSHRQEMSDPFSDGASLMQDQEPGPSLLEGKERSRYGGEVSHRSTSSYSYIDPFEDPVQEESEHQPNRSRDSIAYEPMSGATMISHPQAVAHAVRIITPSSIAVYPLSPLLEHMPDVGASDHDQATTSSHTQSSGILSGTYGSPVTSQTSVEPFCSISKPTIEHSEPPMLRSPSIIPASVPPSGIRRSDSWWSRFYRTSFLDRRPSSASHRSNILDIRDPNPPPALIPIEESTSSASAEEISLQSVNDLTGSKQLSNSPSRVYTIDPGKSMTSLRTADTEQIEKMAVGMDVVQRVRTPSQMTSNSIGSGLSIDTYKAGSNHKEQGEPLVFSLSPTEAAPPFNIPTQGSLEQPTHNPVIPVSPRSSPPISYPYSPPGSASKPSVADRIKVYERRMSQDQGVLPSVNTRKLEERSPKKERVTINYGLTPRANLFVVNPDHRNSRSSDS